jgi:hypothetical protein
VTIGRGYDLKTKSASEVREDFRKAGISAETTEKYVSCIGLSGNEARAKV